MNYDLDIWPTTKRIYSNQKKKTAYRTPKWRFPSSKFQKNPVQMFKIVYGKMAFPTNVFPKMRLQNVFNISKKEPLSKCIYIYIFLKAYSKIRMATMDQPTNLPTFTSIFFNFPRCKLYGNHWCLGFCWRFTASRGLEAEKNEEKLRCFWLLVGNE